MQLAPASFKSTVFVVIQFVCLIAIFINVNFIPNNISVGIGIAIFLILGFWAMSYMKFRFNIAPDISSGKDLVQKGPYKFIRHPMYTSVLGITLCYIINEFSPLGIVIYVILMVNFIMKLKYEEKILLAKFPEYTDYMKSTRTLIPFIY